MFAYEILSACEAVRKLEFMHKVVRLHLVACPPSLSIDKVELIDLEPSSTDASVCNSVFDRLEKMGDRTGVNDGGPLDLDRVTSLGFKCLDNWCVLDGNIAGHVVAIDVFYG